MAHTTNEKYLIWATTQNQVLALGLLGRYRRTDDVRNATQERFSTASNVARRLRGDLIIECCKVLRFAWTVTCNHEETTLFTSS